MNVTQLQHLSKSIENIRGVVKATPVYVENTPTILLDVDEKLYPNIQDSFFIHYNRLSNSLNPNFWECSTLLAISGHTQLMRFEVRVKVIENERYTA